MLDNQHSFIYAILGFRIIPYVGYTRIKSRPIDDKQLQISQQEANSQWLIHV